MAAIIPAGTPLSGELSVLSYNVLLPNSVDGWWVYKYYSSSARRSSEWPHRQSLLRQQILNHNATVVCLQECSPGSFESDFAFMADAGYTAHALLNKGRMRNATFVLASKAAIVSSFCKDRTLTTRLRLTGSGAEVFVVNCHLSAGSQAPRRLRQVHGAVEGVKKQVQRLAKEAGQAAPALEAIPVVVCGDFNSSGRSGVRELLAERQCGPDFRESGDPTERTAAQQQLTSKLKKSSLGSFTDAYEEAYGAVGREPPPTLVAASLMEAMVDDAGSATPALVAALRALFDRFSSNGAAMTRPEVERWLIAINLEMGRGSEFRAAEAVLRAKGGRLPFEDFLGIYQAELDGGKFWGVEHDLARVLDGNGLASAGSAPFCARFDHIFYTSGVLKCTQVAEPLTDEQGSVLFESKSAVLPNDWHPSDHLHLAAAFDFLPAKADG